MMQISGVVADVSAVLPIIGYNSRHFHAFPDSKSPLFLSIPKGFPSFCFRKLGIGSEQFRASNFAIKASGNASGDLVPIAPVQLESSVGQFLAEILRNYPHLLPATLDQQLENLQGERDEQTEKTPPSSQDLLLYKNSI